MLSTLSYLPRLAAQIYRSGQAFVALRQLHRGAAQGASVTQNAGLSRLARALQVHPTVALDIYLGRLRPDISAEDIVSARRTLQGTKMLSPLLAPLSRNTAFQAESIFKDVARTHRTAIRNNGKLLREMATKSRADGKRVRQLQRQGLKHQARAVQESRAFDVNAMSELNQETETLLRGASGKLVD